ncbi:MAG TPA: TonB-dependent siderophore receptor [Steroidobacteraceae bacterium]
MQVEDDALDVGTGYQPTTTRIGRFEQALIDIPQSVTVLTAPLLEDRGVDSLEDALRNVASLTFNAGEGGRIGDNITLRGYSIVGDLFLDGMRDIAQYNREVFNLEQVEVLRGSASMLFGRGSTGGVVNQVSRQPERRDFANLGVTFGSFDYYRGTIDYNQALGDTAALRINAMGTDSDSFRSTVQQERWGVAPSLALGLGTNDTWTLSYYRLEDDNIPDYGVPYFEGRPLDVPNDRFYGLGNADYERNATGISTIVYQHRFDADTALRTVLRHGDYSRDLWATAPRLAAGTTAITDDTVINRQRQARGGEEQTWTSQTDFTTKFAALGMRHELLAGVELVREDAQRWNYATTVANPATTVGHPDPFPNLPPEYFADVTRVSPMSYSADTVGIYLQDVVALTAHWKVLAGARYDDFSADYERPLPQGNLSRTDRVLSWRTGVMYQPTPAQSWYVSYGTSFNPSGELYALDDRSSNTPPEKSRNAEVGVKWDLVDGMLSVRTALARSEKTDERNTDLSMPDVYLLSGRRHTDSFEVEVVGRPIGRLEVFGAASLMWANIDEASGQQAGSLDKVPVNTPDYTASLWATWRLGRHWTAGGGVDAVGSRYANAGNTIEVPGYTRFDAMVSYTADRLSVQLNALNLTDVTYYEGVYQGHVVPGTTRALRLRLGYAF